MFEKERRTIFLGNTVRNLGNLENRVYLCPNSNKLFFLFKKFDKRSQIVKNHGASPTRPDLKISFSVLAARKSENLKD